MKKGFGILLILGFLGIFSSCAFTYDKKIEELDQVVRYGNYEIVGPKGIISGQGHYIFVEEICKKIKDEGKTVKNALEYIRDYYFIGDRFYFLYNYYGKKKLSGEITDSSFALGYVDLKSKTVTCLEYYEQLNSNDHHRFHHIMGDYLFLGIGDRFLVYQVETRKIIFEESINDISIAYSLLSSETLMFRKDGFQNFYYLSNGELVHKKITFEATEDYFDYYLSGRNVIYRIVGKNSFFGYNFESGERLSEDIVLELVSEYHKIREEMSFDKYTLDGINYFIDRDKEKIDFINRETEEKTTLTIEDVKKASSAYHEITKIFNQELKFFDVIIEGDQLYLVLYNNSSFFGMYDGSPPPIVYHYDLKTNELNYIGYYVYVYYPPVKVYAK